MSQGPENNLKTLSYNNKSWNSCSTKAAARIPQGDAGEGRGGWIWVGFLGNHLVFYNQMLSWDFLKKSCGNYIMLDADFPGRTEASFSASQVDAIFEIIALSGFLFLGHWGSLSEVTSPPCLCMLISVLMWWENKLPSTRKFLTSCSVYRFTTEHLSVLFMWHFCGHCHWRLFFLFETFSADTSGYHALLFLPPTISPSPVVQAPLLLGSCILTSP